MKCFVSSRRRTSLSSSSGTPRWRKGTRLSSAGTWLRRRALAAVGEPWLSSASPGCALLVKVTATESTVKIVVVKAMARVLVVKVKYGKHLGLCCC